MTVVWIAASIGLAWWRPEIVARLRLRRTAGPVDPATVAGLLAIALSAGRPLGSALETIGDHLDPRSAAAVDDVLARSRLEGLGRALAGTQGPLADLCGRLARAHLTGAPALTTVQAYLTSVHDARRARAVEEARTLGVRLIIPVTLLLLPGFVALVIGPYVFDQLGWLLGGAGP